MWNSRPRLVFSRRGRLLHISWSFTRFSEAGLLGRSGPARGALHYLGLFQPF